MRGQGFWRVRSSSAGAQKLKSGVRDQSNTVMYFDSHKRPVTYGEVAASVEVSHRRWLMNHPEQAALNRWRNTNSFLFAKEVVR